MNRKQEILQDLKEDFVAKVMETVEKMVNEAEYFTQYLTYTSYTSDYDITSTNLIVKCWVPNQENAPKIIKIEFPHNTNKNIKVIEDDAYNNSSAWTVKHKAKYYLMATDIATFIEAVNKDDVKI